ncbi:hypothetical protein [Haloferula sp.]|jgi:hypothetical protein|uniref:hypothetical protein n=1 Tax=Haloferula sp. TaxID=2497595 RepID=UPI003C7092B8
MNRLIRIALTMFVSSTILLLLVRQRLKQVEGLADDVVRSEAQMASVGLIIAGALAAGGFILIIVAMTRTRRKKLPKHE